MDKTYYVYMLASSRMGTLYVGVTNNLARRVYEHRAGVVEGFTRTYSVKRLVWFEATSSIESAIQREKNLKHWVRKWKVNLIEKTNPEWRDLYEEIVS